MNNNQTSIIVKEFFNIVAPFLSYRSCELICETERKIMSLLCEINKCSHIADECWRIVDDTRRLESYADGTLLLSSEVESQSFAYDMKMEALSTCKNDLIRVFDEFVFVEELKAEANVGEKSACKLLAFLSWLGLIMPRNSDITIKVCSVLSATCDWQSLKMLIYVCDILGDECQLAKWTHIYRILKSEFDSFSAVALFSNYPEYSEEEVEIANLILFVSQRDASNGSLKINRSSIHYLLNSKDDYKTKMTRLSTETNFNLLMYLEDKDSTKKYGF